MTPEQRTFPRLDARDLSGTKRRLPDAFEATANLVFVAFRREQQELIDSWATWVATEAAEAGIVSYEVPVLARHWAPLRPMIDGGMAAAIRDLETRRRTFTVYGDVGRVTGPLGITDRSTVWTFLLAADGEILDVAQGGFDEATARRLLAAVAGQGTRGRLPNAAFGAGASATPPPGTHAARRRTNQSVAATSRRESTSSHPPSIH